MVHSPFIVHLPVNLRRLPTDNQCAILILLAEVERKDRSILSQLKLRFQDFERWDLDFPLDGSQKIEPDPKKPAYLMSEHSMGYRFEDQQAAV